MLKAEKSTLSYLTKHHLIFPKVLEAGTVVSYQHNSMPGLKYTYPLSLYLILHHLKDPLKTIVMRGDKTRSESDFSSSTDSEAVHSVFFLLPENRPILKLELKQ